MQPNANANTNTNTQIIMTNLTGPTVPISGQWDAVEITYFSSDRNKYFVQYKC